MSLNRKILNSKSFCFKVFALVYIRKHFPTTRLSFYFFLNRKTSLRNEKYIQVGIQSYNIHIRAFRKLFGRKNIQKIQQMLFFEEHLLNLIVMQQLQKYECAQSFLVWIEECVLAGRSRTCLCVRTYSISFVCACVFRSKKNCCSIDHAQHK